MFVVDWKMRMGWCWYCYNFIGCTNGHIHYIHLLLQSIYSYMHECIVDITTTLSTRHIGNWKYPQDYDVIIIGPRLAKSLDGAMPICVYMYNVFFNGLFLLSLFLRGSHFHLQQKHTRTHRYININTHISLRYSVWVIVVGRMAPWIA